MPLQDTDPTPSFGGFGLSKRVRRLRRKARSASGRVDFHDGRVEAIDIRYLLAVPESVLKLMGYAVALLSLGWLVARL